MKNTICTALRITGKHSNTAENKNNTTRPIYWIECPQSYIIKRPLE